MNTRAVLTLILLVACLLFSIGGLIEKSRWTWYLGTLGCAVILLILQVFAK